MKKRIFMYIILALTLIPLSSGWAGNTVEAKVSFATDLTAAEAQDNFSTYDKIYALVTLSGLQPGSQKAVINWIDPGGNLNQYREIPFTIGKQTSYTFYSWIRLLKNGPMKSTISGKRFDDEYIGRWEFHLFLNGTLLEKMEFTLHP